MTEAAPGRPAAAHGRLLATISGRVQGVGFRWYVHREAERLGVTGWVTNRAGGDVEVVAEAPHDVLDQLLLALWEGPMGSSVRDVAIRFEPARGNLHGFVVHTGEHRGD